MLLTGFKTSGYAIQKMEEGDIYLRRLLRGSFKEPRSVKGPGSGSYAPWGVVDLIPRDRWSFPAGGRRTCTNSSQASNRMSRLGLQGHLTN